MLALLLLAWMFDRVTTDCHGQPESVAYYELRATVVRQADTICYDDQGLPFTCPQTYFDAPISFLRIYDAGTGPTVVIPQDYVANPDLLPLCGPPPCVVGWPWFTPVVAVDAADNESTDPCPPWTTGSAAC